MFSPRPFAIQLCWFLSLIVPLVSGIDFLEFGNQLGFRPEENTRQQFTQNTGFQRTGGNFRESTTPIFRASSAARVEPSIRPASSTRAIVTSQAAQVVSSAPIIRTTAVVSNTIAMGTVSSSVAEQISSAAALPITTSTQAAPPVITTTSSISSVTNLVTPTSSAIAQQDTTEQASGQSALAPSPTPSLVTLPDAVSFPASDREGLSPMGQLGVSFGVTFGILALAAGVAVWIWYKRRHPRIKIGTTTSETRDNGSGSGSGFTGLTPFAAVTGYFKRKKNKDVNDDQEWSIESAERVSIVKNMQAQSVSTVTRSNSKSSEKLDEDEISNATTMKEGRTNGLALNPITPKSAVFPMPPTSTDVVKLQEKPEEVKPSEWPLNR